MGVAMRAAVKTSVRMDKECCISAEENEVAQASADLKLKEEILAQKFYIDNSRIGGAATLKQEQQFLRFKGTAGPQFVRKHESVGYRNVVADQLRAARDTHDEIPSYSYLADILNSVSQRSRASKNAIITTLKDETELGPSIDDCSPADLAKLAQECTLKSCIHKTEQLAAEGGNVNGLYVIIKGTVRIHYGGDILIKKAGDIMGDVLLRGIRTWNMSVTVWKHEVLHLCMIPANAVLQYIGSKRADTPIFMHCFWKYARIWPLFEDPRSTSQQVRDSVLSISTSVNYNRNTVHMAFQPSATEPNALAARVTGVDATCQSIDDVGTSPAEEVHDAKSDGTDDEEDVTTESLVSGLRPTIAPPMPMEPHMSTTNLKHANSRKVIDPCRIHYFQANQDIFRAGDPRHFLYIVVKGECVLVRPIRMQGRSRTPSPSTGARRRPQPGCIGKGEAQDIPEGTQQSLTGASYDRQANEVLEVDVGQHLLPGDFCFMDGESAGWFDKFDESISRKLGQLTDAPILFRRSNLFGEHRHNLQALTMSEICVVPLQNVYECGAVFITMLKLMNENYPGLIRSDIELLGARTENMMFAGNRPKLVTRLISESLGRLPTQEAILSTHHRKDKMLHSYKELLKEHNSKITSAKEALLTAKHTSASATMNGTICAANITSKGLNPVPPPEPLQPAPSALAPRMLRVHVKES
jgi:CRP-like cAMP-binding protein